jgi:hypothetical protein
MARFINTVLIRLAQSNTTVRRDMESKTKEAIKRMEEKSSSIIQRTIDVILNWVTKLLARQQKTDFRPRDNEIGESLQTAACASICTFLNRTLQTISQALDGPNLETFGSELAISIRDLLVEHFKKFQVSAMGGLMVTKDMAKYVATLKEWPARKEITGSLDVLSEIGNLFIIGPEALKERARNIQTAGNKGKGLERQDLRAFVSRRDDAASVGIQSVLAVL